MRASQKFHRKGKLESMASDNCLVGSSASAFSISDLRVGFWPLIATIGLGFAVLLPSGLANAWAVHLIGRQQATAMPWIPIYINHVAMLVVALIIIGLLSKGRFADYGLRWPKGKSYVAAALAWGLLAGIWMTLVDYFPQIMAHVPPEKLPLTVLNIFGWLTFEGVFVGFGEEIPFRGLMQTFLMKRTSGRVRFLKYDMHVAGVILALLFALAHAANFWTRPFLAALGQQTYAFGLGILYAYWYEKSGSLLASIIGHNMGDVVEYALIFLLAWRWH